MDTSLTATLTDRRTAGRRAALLVVLGLVAFTGVILAQTTSGLGGDPRTVNPNPGPRPYEPFLGVANWPLVATFAFAAIGVAVIGVFIRLSVREGRLHWGAIIFLAVLAMSVFDPLVNWATFVVFDPRMPHFPMSWPYIRAVPLVEPVVAALGGYPMFYVPVSLGLVWVYKRFVAGRVAPGSWPDRHPLLAIGLFAFVAGAPITLIANPLWMRVGIYTITQSWGPTFSWANVTFPPIVSLFDMWVFGWTSALMFRDDRGRSHLLSTLARRIPLRGTDRTSPLRQLAAGTALMLAVHLTVTSVFIVIRVARLTHPIGGPFPYTEAKLYDPYGDQADAGRPGPFYR